MKLKDLIKFIDEKIPPNLALDFDEVGFKKEYDLNEEITNIVVFMDLLPQWDNYPEGTIIITHHPPQFIPKTPTYTIHSNWDIIDGGANDALADVLKAEVYDYFDSNTKIGRVCKCSYTFGEMKKILSENFSDVRTVNSPDDDDKIEKIGVISGFGLKNPDYIKLAHDKNLNLLVSGDLVQETAILAKVLGVSLIDLGHHTSELPGLYKLAEIFDDFNVEVIDIKPFEKIR